MSIKSYKYIQEYKYSGFPLAIRTIAKRELAWTMDICENWVANFRRFGELKMPMQQHTNSRMLIKI